MRHFEHSPAYVAQIRQSWRVVVPIRGRLSPKVCAPEFDTQIGAIAWLQSAAGQQEIALARATRRSIVARDSGLASPHRLLAEAVPA
jgi:hypothetical protein